MGKAITEYDAVRKTYLVKRGSSSCYITLPRCMFGKSITIKLAKNQLVYK